MPFARLMSAVALCVVALTTTGAHAQEKSNSVLIQKKCPVLAPKLSFRGRKLRGGGWHYFLQVTNWADYCHELFVLSKAYPCGRNSRASRTRLKIYDDKGSEYIYGYCALGNPKEMRTKITFWIRKGDRQPKKVFIGLQDLKTGNKAYSNRVDVTGPAN